MASQTQPQPMLPISQLESSRFKLTQIMESIVALQRTVEQGGASVMPAWPDILAKYNVLLSQTLNLSMALVSVPPSGGAAEPTLSSESNASSKPFSKLALHPSSALPDSSLDNDLIPLLRNLQTTEVLRLESSTVRRLSAALPSPVPTLLKERPSAPETHAAVLQACAEIKNEHDARCDRASRAVSLLREKHEWRARVAVEMEEEEEEFVGPNALSPQFGMSPMPLPPPTTTGTGTGTGDSTEMYEDEEMAIDEGDKFVNGDEDQEEGDTGEEAELEEVLGPSLQPSPGESGTPGAGESVASTPR